VADAKRVNFVLVYLVSQRAKLPKNVMECVFVNSAQKYSAKLSKIHSYRLLFSAIFPLGCIIFYYYHSTVTPLRFMGLIILIIKGAMITLRVQSSCLI